MLVKVVILIGSLCLGTHCASGSWDHDFNENSFKNDTAFSPLIEVIGDTLSGADGSCLASPAVEILDMISSKHSDIAHMCSF